MQLSDAQKAVHATAVYPGANDKGNLPYLAISLVGEAGEFCNVLKKAIRGDDTREGLPEAPMVGGVPMSAERLVKLRGELRGTAWYLFELWNLLGVNADDEMAILLNELAGREQRGTLQGDGDNR